MGIYIKGAGMTKFDIDMKNSHDRIYECINEAFESKNIGMDEIDAIFVSNGEAGSNGERQKHVSPMLSSMFQKKMQS